MKLDYNVSMMDDNGAALSVALSWHSEWETWALSLGIIRTFHDRNVYLKLNDDRIHYQVTHLPRAKKLNFGHKRHYKRAALYP